MMVGNVHLVRGSDIDGLSSFLETEGFAIRANADAYVRSYGQFGIDEARELRDRASSRALGRAPRMFVIACTGMTNEAQNALLKTLEEPPGGAHFFFLTPAPETLLPTLRSRAQTLTIPDRKASRSGLVDAQQFLAAQPAARLDMLKPLLERDEDDRRDLGEIITFLSSLERMLVNRMQGDDLRESAEALYRARRYLGDRGALVKPLLEQVALLVPIMKT